MVSEVISLELFSFRQVSCCVEIQTSN